MLRTGLNLRSGKSLGLEGTGRPGGQTKGQNLTQVQCLQRDPWVSGQPTAPKGYSVGPDPDPADLARFRNDRVALIPTQQRVTPRDDIRLSPSPPPRKW